jgi:hypothetical protein
MDVLQQNVDAKEKNQIKEILNLKKVAEEVSATIS